MASSVEGHIAGATTLSVLNDAARSMALVGLLTGRAVGHTIVGFYHLILVRGDLVLVNGHAFALLALDGGLLVKRGGDGPGLEGALADAIALVWRRGTRPPREAVASIVVEAARLKVAPIVATRLRGRTIIVGVEGARECWSIHPSSRQGLLRGKAEKHEGGRDMHPSCVKLRSAKQNQEDQRQSCACGKERMKRGYEINGFAPR